MISTRQSVNTPPNSTQVDALLVLEPPRHSRLFPSLLGPGKHLIGAGDDCDIHIEANGVQPHHAIVMVADHVILLKALDNRTWVNDGAVTEVALRTGDRLSIGPITFRLRFATKEELQQFSSLSPDKKMSRSTQITRSRRKTCPGESADTEHTTDEQTVPPKDLQAPPERTSTPDPVVRKVQAKPTVVEVTAPPVAPPSKMGQRTDSNVAKRQTPQTSATVRPAVSEQPKRATPPVETHVQEIQRQIAILQDETAVFDAAREATRAQSTVLLEEKRQLAIREEELKQLADELSRQSQRLRERSERLTQREQELDHKHSLLAGEHERLVATAETSRRELTEEYARQQALWQEWDAAYRRTTVELKSQLEAVELRRKAIQTENEKLVADRSEIQRLQAEYDQQRRAISAERVQLAASLSDLHAQRAAFETERRELFASVQSRESQVASERHALTLAQDELLAAREQFEHDRTLFATERSAESQRREQEVREHTQARLRLNDEEEELQETRLAIEAMCRSLDEHLADFQHEKAAFEADQAEIATLRAKLDEAENQLALYQQSQGEQQQRKDAEEEARRRSEELQEWQATLEAQQTQLESVRASLQVEQDALVTARQELAEARAALKNDSSQFVSRGDESAGQASIDDLLGLSAAERPQHLVDNLPEYVSSTAPYYQAAVASSGLSYLPPPQLPIPSYAVENLNTPSSSFPNMRNDDAAIQVRSTVEMDSLTRPMPEREGSDVVLSVRDDSRRASADRIFTDFMPASIEAPSYLDSNATTVDGEVSPVDEALSEINQRFGFSVGQYRDEVSPSYDSPLSDESIVHRDRVATEFAASSDIGTSADVLSSAPESHRSAADESLERLRAQLAEMLLPEGHSPGDADSAATEASKLYETDESGQPSDENETVDLHSQADLKQPNREDADNRQADASSEDEDEWTRRLRELSQVATAASPPPSAKQEVVEAQDDAANETEDDEYSVEAQLARLLGKPRLTRDQNNSTGNANPAMATQARSTNDADLQTEGADLPHDHSHLASEPKHKQNKHAVREEVQSFRAVAQMSARTALAKHSWNNLKNEIYFTSTVTLASMFAAIWFVGNYVYGTEKEVWKGATCAAATAVCGQKLIRRLLQLRQSGRTRSVRSCADTKLSRTEVKPDPDNVHEED
jgi:hypothetical protein